MIFCPTLALHSIIYPCLGLGWLAWLRYHMFSLIDRDTHNKRETLHWWSLIRKLCSNGWWRSENDQQCVMMNETDPTPWLNNWARMGRQPEKEKVFHPLLRAEKLSLYQIKKRRSWKGEKALFSQYSRWSGFWWDPSCQTTLMDSSRLLFKDNIDTPKQQNVSPSICELWSNVFSLCVIASVCSL